MKDAGLSDLVLILIVVVLVAFVFRKAHGAEREGHLLYGEWVVVRSAVSLDYEPHPDRYEVRKTTVTVHDLSVGSFQTKEIAEDLAFALNDAHAARLEREHPHLGVRK